MFASSRLIPLALCTCLAGAASQASGAALTPQEVRWLQAAAPVLAYGQSLQLPLTITVQPRARPGDVALAMGFVDGRCKLVLSLRGNPGAARVVAGVPEAQRAVLIETMAAHELGHCWRHARHAWHTLPVGFIASGKGMNPDGAARREEAYADLAALAWVRWRHPGQYASIYRWLQALRSDAPGASHDTRAWLRLARDPGRLGPVTQPFAGVAALWREVALNAD